MPCRCPVCGRFTDCGELVCPLCDSHVICKDGNCKVKIKEVKPGVWLVKDGNTYSLKKD